MNPPSIYEQVRIVRFGRQAVLGGEVSEPSIWSHIDRVRPFKWRWYLTAGPDGPIVSEGGYAWRAKTAQTHANMAALSAKFRGGVQ